MRRQPGARLFSTRKGWVPNRPLIRPSVRTGAPSPQGEGFGGMSLIWGLSFAKMLSSIFPLENASQIGFSIPDVTAPLSYQRQRSPKRANESERAINPGSRGKAPALFLPISREKWGPPPGRRGNGALRPKGASEPPTPRVRTRAPPPGRESRLPTPSIKNRLRRPRRTGRPAAHRTPATGSVSPRPPGPPGGSPPPPGRPPGR